MDERDLILDARHAPVYDEIAAYITEPARGLWQEMNAFIRQSFKVVPKITYSKCSAKPGWNVKYQKSGKSLCTLYPELEGFVALVVVTLDMVSLIEAMSSRLDASVLETMREARPFNGTLWLMIQVSDRVVLNSVRELILLKMKK
ncbi:Protein of unknown function [Desulfotomaculum arcticum]|uniref:DUF3788 domain-containing protein n=1 Tax=Desulfotruncus arcticus DSM 17038 TaxID=1121424 RepID=A0A1I2WLE8_9FIRM|nr:DUF3788 domain-containing protein [Desulfotruncus arcticus]SFH00421.1 Protein of unknown function [Desulfotomaculum arcticum] [Desulfotruncus arcticus DSM 17038]